MAFSNGDILALVCWPLIVAGLLLFFLLRCKQQQLDARQRRLLTFIAASVVVIPLFLVTWFAKLSASMLINQYLLIIGIGSVLLAELYLRRGIDPAWRVALMASAGPAMIAVGMWTLVGDYVMPREVLEGAVTRTTHRVKVRRPVHYSIFIDGRDFATTAEVYDLVHRGQRIRAEIGAGSHTILRAELR
ncbi:MAG TPA: hypothetical protein VGH49_17720 [Xanthobacteraceae bacterium]